MEYADFVKTTEWDSAIDALKEINPEWADAVDKHGIADAVHNGEYDFEAGRLLEDLPKQIADAISDNDEAYGIVCDLAHAYAEAVNG